MMLQQQNLCILDYLNENVRNELFDGLGFTRIKKEKAATRYKRDDSILSAICSRQIFNVVKFFATRDVYTVSTIKKETYSGTIPMRFAVLNWATLAATVLPLVIMFLDYCYGWTSMGAFTYCYISACGLSLFITAKIAKREWMVHNWDEQDRKKKESKF